ncbi:hypothetical protein ACFWDA_25850 [Rhodococcus zopfii]|nr:hypothetical protein [Rhodococcus zopfii]
MRQSFIGGAIVWTPASGTKPSTNPRPTGSRRSRN